MVQNLCFGGIGRFIRVALSFVLSRLIALPLITQVPGLAQWLSNTELKEWLAVALAGLICGLMKKGRDSGKIPRWMPL